MRIQPKFTVANKSTGIVIIHGIGGRVFRPRLKFDIVLRAGQHSKEWDKTLRWSKWVVLVKLAQ